jgi:methionyl-tRNA synthetase
MTKRPLYCVVAPPPTPNGDLHVGHLSGPYLAADVFVRFRRLCGARVLSAVATDPNQSYVVTTAERMGKEPHALAQQNFRLISDTLRAADIEFGTVREPDQAYEQFVTDFFLKLHNAGAFVSREQTVLRDSDTGRYLVEAFVQGACPTCLSPSKGNICEACGHPNDPTVLLNPSPTGRAREKKLERSSVLCLSLELERFRSRIETFYGKRRENLRPTLRRLLDELLARELPDFPITHAATWGIAAPFPGFESSVLNVWAEMYPGHLYWLEADRRRQGLHIGDEERRYVQFLGFDNSFFYAVAHLGLAFAAEDAGCDMLMPDQLVTNEFYLLDHAKFSTSQNHVIWGRDLLRSFSVDAVRFYLALTNPEFQQSNFASAEMERRVVVELITPFERIVAAYNALTEQGVNLGGDASAWEGCFSAFRNRMESAFEDGFSLRSAAQTVANYLAFVAEIAAIPPVHGSSARRRAELHAALANLAVFSSPLMPSFAGRLASALGLAAPLTWSREATFPSSRASGLPPQLLSLAVAPAKPLLADLHDDLLERDLA